MAQQLFGRSGTRLIALLDEGSGAIAGQAQHMKDLGVAFDEQGAAKVGAFDDAMDDLHQTMAGVARIVAIGLLPSLTEWSKKLGSVAQSTEAAN